MSAQESLRDRLDFIGLDERSLAALRDLKPVIQTSIGPALAAFYDKVRANPETRRFFKDEKHITGAKGRQERHWDIIASGDFGEAYERAVRAVGQTHARLGLEPRWYIGGYALVTEQLIHAVVRNRWPRFLRQSMGGREAMATALASLMKAVLLDIDLSVSIYLEAIDHERRRAEEARVMAQQQQASALQLLATALAGLADGDLTARMKGEVAADFETLKVDFNASVDKLQQAMLAVNANAQAIRGGSDEISRAADDLSRRTEQQAASLEETAASLDEITATVNKTAEGVKHVREVVSAAQADAEKSSGIVRKTVEAMSEIETSSKQISRIIGVIDEIAFQTNLLALNAGVEAARAGEAGRGFAVVASEVRALAQRSAEAAKEIKSLISTAAEQVDTGVGLVRQTGHALERIVTQVADINTVVVAIAAGAQEQASGLHQVNTAVNEMDQVTQQNAAMVEQTTAAAHGLAKEIEELGRSIDRFEIEEAVPVSSPHSKAVPATRPAMEQPRLSPAYSNSKNKANSMIKRRESVL